MEQAIAALPAALPLRALLRLLEYAAHEDGFDFRAVHASAAAEEQNAVGAGHAHTASPLPSGSIGSQTLSAHSLFAALRAIQNVSPPLLPEPGDEDEEATG
eukprot:scaffold5320_cov350-Prasinococcus_capsulatus_cf.AAC.3